jgi:hypothetical protein
MTIAAILADLRETHRWPEEAEVELVIAEGDYAQVSEMLAYTACTDNRLARKCSALKPKRSGTR